MGESGWPAWPCCCRLLSALLLDGWSSAASRSFLQIGQLVLLASHLQEGGHASTDAAAAVQHNRELSST